MILALYDKSPSPTTNIVVAVWSELLLLLVVLVLVVVVVVVGAHAVISVVVVVVVESIILSFSGDASSDVVVVVAVVLLLKSRRLADGLLIKGRNGHLLRAAVVVMGITRWCSRACCLVDQLQPLTAISGSDLMNSSIVLYGTTTS